MGDRCTGQCCSYFSIGSPETAYARIERDLHHDDPKEREEAALLKEMLIYRGYVINPIYKDDGVPLHWWTCKNFVVEGDHQGHCAIYEKRPFMCRYYPNGKPCQIPGCSWDWAQKPQRRAIDVPVLNLTRRGRMLGFANLIPADYLAAAGLPLQGDDYGK